MNLQNPSDQNPLLDPSKSLLDTSYSIDEKEKDISSINTEQSIYSESFEELGKAYDEASSNLHIESAQDISKPRQHPLLRLVNKAKHGIQSIFKKKPIKQKDAVSQGKTEKKIISFTQFMLLKESEREGYDFNMTMDEYLHLSQEMKENYTLYSLRQSLNSKDPAHVDAAIKETEKYLNSTYASRLATKTLFQQLLKDLEKLRDNLLTEQKAAENQSKTQKPTINVDGSSVEEEDTTTEEQKELEDNLLTKQKPIIIDGSSVEEEDTTTEEQKERDNFFAEKKAAENQSKTQKPTINADVTTVAQEDTKAKEQKELREKFSDLYTKVRTLNPDLETRKLVFSDKEDKFIIKTRKRGISEKQKGTSSVAKETANKAIQLLRTLLDKDCYVKGDIAKLNELKAYLNDMLGSTFKHDQELQRKFTTLFQDIDNSRKNFPNKLQFERNHIDDFLDKYREPSLDNIYEALFEMGGKIQDEFIKGGPWLKLKNQLHPFEGKNLDALMDRMIVIFKSDKESQKTNALQLLEKMLDREIIPNSDSNDKLKEVVQVIKESNSIKAEVKKTLDHQLKAQPSKQTAITNEAVPDRSIDLEQQLNAIAKGNLESEAKKQFVRQFATDLMTMHANLFTKIKASEFHGANWGKKPEKAPNITALIAQTNNLTNFVTQEVLKPGLKIEERQRVVEMFLEVADYMINQQSPHDYQGACAILYALNQNPIARLSKASSEDKRPNLLTERSQELLLKLPNLKDATLQEVRNRIGKDLKGNSEGPQSAIPYAVMFLKDFFSANEGSPDLTDEGTPNIDKALIFAKLHGDIELMQSTLEVDQKLYMTKLPKMLNPEGGFPSEEKFDDYSDKIWSKS